MLKMLKEQTAQAVSVALQGLTSNPPNESKIREALERPKKQGQGHLSFPVFALSKELRRSPPEVAQQLASSVSSPGRIRSVSSLSGFVNFEFEPAYLQSLLLQSLGADKSKIGASDQHHGKTVVIDYSSPNIAKPMSIGHLRATVIGQAIRNLAESQGFKVIGINHLGDWGSQFGKLVHAYLSYGHEYDFKNQPFESLFKIYVRFHEEAENNPELEAKGAECFRKLESGDPEVTKIWNHFREISIQEYGRLYDLLGIKFELIQGEAFYNDKLEDAVERIRKAGILEESQGALVVNVGEGKPPCIVRKSDGSSIYATRDIASAIFRKEVLKGDEILYVVGVDQNLHFEQVFKVLERMGYSWAQNCHHIAFGMYRFKDLGRMSTRKGNVIFMEDVLQRAIDEVANLMTDKITDPLERRKTAEVVGIGAIIFNDLKNDRQKNVDFDWGQVLNFEGDSGPYLQYVAVRCQSIERKLGGSIKLEMPKALVSKEEENLVLTLLSLDETLTQAYRTYRPNVLASYLLDLSHCFNVFYHHHKVLQEPDQDLRQSRLALVKSTQMVLERGLSILGIKSPEQM